jgi:outer membrane protein insertion porin family
MKILQSMRAQWINLEEQPKTIPSNPMVWTLGIVFSLNRSIAFLLTFLLCVIAVCPVSVLAEEDSGSPRIAAIRSPSLTPSETALILKSLGLEVGSYIDKKRLDHGIKALIESGKVQTLSIFQSPTPKGVEVELEVGLARKLKDMDLSQVRADIRDEIALSLSHLETGKVLEPRYVAALKQAIKVAYESRGYFFVDVDTVVKKSPESDSLDLKVNVIEGTPTQVSRIKLSNVDKEESDEFRRAIPLKVGDPFTKMALEASINSLNEYFVANQYPDSKVDETNLNFNENKTRVEVEFVLKVGEKYQFIFIGNEVFTSDVIRQWITADVLGQSDTIRFIERLIEEKYREVGYHFCKVTTVFQKNKRDKVQSYRFEIDEGPRVIVDSIIVNGASEIGVSKFRSLFYDQGAGILKRGVFWEDGLVQTCKNMRQYLEDDGYLNVSLPTPRVSFTEDKRGADLIFNVELGSQTRISRIDIQGVLEDRRKQIEGILLFKVGDPVRRSLIEKSKEEIEKFYLREGFTDVKISKKDDIVYGEDPSRAIVRIGVDEGKQFFVGNITIEGNRFTKLEVIDREIRLKPGDKYNIEKIRQSEDELLLTGLFSRAEMIGTVDSKDSSKKNIKVAVLETKAGSGELGLGAVYEDPRFRVRGFVGMAYNNVFGLNQTASIRTEIGLPLTQKFERVPFIEYSAILGYRAPYLFKIPAIFFSQASLDNYEVGTSSNGKISNLQTRARIEERIEKRFSQTFKFIYRLHRYERATTKTLVFMDANDPNNPTNPSGNNYQPDFSTATEVVDIGSTGPGFEFDFRDDRFNPTSGSLHTLDGELAHSALFSSKDVGFYMLMARNSFYVPLFEPLGLALFAGAGYADSLDHNKPIPKARLLTDLSLGGQGSIRGFSPRIFNPQPDSVTSGFYNLRGELRSTLVGDLSAAIFIDSGQIFSKTAGSAWESGARHDGVGVGLRYKTPVGPAVIDISQGLGPDKEVIKFNFTIGVF